MNELYNAMRWEKPALLLHIKRGLCKRGGFDFNIELKTGGKFKILENFGA